MLHPTATTIAISSAKGGAGKTSTVCALAAALSGRGHRVGIIDADVTDPNLAAAACVDGTTPVAVNDDVHLDVPATAAGVQVLSPHGFERTPTSGAIVELGGYLDVDIVLVDLPPGVDSAHADTLTAGVDGWLAVAPPTAVGLAGHVAHCATLTRVAEKAAEERHKKRDKRRKYTAPTITWASAETCADHLGTLDGTTVTVRRIDAVTPDDAAAAFSATGFNHITKVAAAVDQTDASTDGIDALADWAENVTKNTD